MSRPLFLVLVLWGCGTAPVQEPAAPAFPFDAPVASRYQKEVAERLGLPVEFTTRGLSFVLVPPGTFDMGSPPSEPGRKGDETLHRVTISRPFYLGKTEVSVADFRRFVEATGHVTDVERKGGGHAHDAKAVWKHTPGTSWKKPGYTATITVRDDLPVVHVSHTDATEFCRWLGPEFRLPTEAEWEWACRAGRADRFSWGPEEDPSGRACNAGDPALKRTNPEWPRATMAADDGYPFAAPVGSFRQNAFGLHDMLGNVWEFCGSRHGAYPREATVDPGDLGTQESYSVRGGGWSNEPADLRCAVRNSDPPRFGHSNLGFRVALRLPDDELQAAALALRPDRAPGEKAVLDTLEARAREVVAAIDHPRDRAAWEKAVPRLKRDLRASLGIDRLPKPEPRNVRTVGTVDRGEYRIEKFVYETFPGVDVPVHLYRPASAAGRLPAILFVPGHWFHDSKTHPPFQSFCVTMARKGFVVLSYDPFGQGERGVSMRDHRRTELLPVGVAQQAIIDFESLCALEFLLARPDVDLARVGMTGASGGGYNSWIVPSLDPRVAVSVPVVGTAEFYEQIQVVRERDWYDAKEHCHFVPRLLRYANNHEFLAMIAPRPVLVIAAHKDHSFRIPGIREVVEYGRGLYSALGAPDRLGYFEDELEFHGYHPRKREAAYGWFLKWLKGEGDGSPVKEPSFEPPPWDSAELRCFPPGENRSAGPGLVALAKSLVPAPAADKTPLPRVLQEALGIPLYPRLTASSKLERGPSREARGLRVERVRWVGRDDLEIPGLLVAGRAPWKGALLAASDDGKETLLGHAAVREALEAGFAVLLADPRGLGELATKPGWVFATSLLLGENFVGRQAMDLVAGWRSLAALPELRGKPVALLGSGPFAAQAALYAAVLEPRVSGLMTDKGFSSFRDFIDRPKTVAGSHRLLKAGEETAHRVDREIPSGLIVFDALRRFDLADLRASLAPRPVAVLSAIDGDFQPVAGSGPSAREFFRGLPAPDGAAKPFDSAQGKPLGVNPSAPVERGRFPNRVHAVEDYETDIEKRWWMAGRLETKNVPPGSTRACRGTLANDFDDKMGDPSRLFTAVIFNPVPGPPMGKNTRLAFRYWLQGSDQLRVQIYSLSNGYHRHLTLSGLSRGEWRECTVDMTQLRRPDGSGGPLSEDERIDDIQFYADPTAELIIDDIVLYDAALPDESEPFPKRILFTGGFDTGRQGKDWPGTFEIVPHEKPRTWKTAQSSAGKVEMGLRGSRPVGTAVAVSFRYRAPEGPLWVSLMGPKEALIGAVPDVKAGVWSRASAPFPAAAQMQSAERIDFRSGGGELLVDDVVLYEPGAK